MQNRIIHLALFLALYIAGAFTPSSANDALLSMLTSQLGINEKQASSGINAVLGVVKQHLSTTDYTRLLSSAPDLATLASKAVAFTTGNTAATTTATTATTATAIAAANTTSVADQKASTSIDWIGHVGSWIGAPQLGQMAQLTQTLSQLGLSADMITKFLKIIMDYVQGTGGANMMNMLAGALKF